MKSFCRKFFGIIVLITGLSMGMNAAEVPGAIKYQAVLRDVNGKPLSGKENINLRISLRLEDPVSGQIAYSEEHTGINANAFGIVNLEIGRGSVTSGTTLQDVAWDGHSVYIQIEVETDGNGFTNMGTSELLTVPYAFMAGNVAGQKLYENLDDNFLPKFNAANRTLVNSGLSQTGRDLKVDASSITFLNSAQGSAGYTFPTSVGKRGQTLVLDNMGNLKWENIEGVGIGGGLNGDLDAEEDGKLIYWNNPLGELAAAPITYRYASDKGFSLVGDMDMNGNLKLNGSVDAGTFKTSSSGVEINGKVTGNNNLLTDDMGDAQIWIGNTQTPLVPRALSGHVHMDNTGKTQLNIAWKGLRLFPGNAAAGAPDTVGLVLSLGDSLWLRNAEDNLYAYNKGKSLNQTNVGIGTDSPQSMLHVQGGDVLFSASANTDGNTPRFSWYPEKSALRVGALSPANSTNWDKTQVGEYSVAFGLDALAESAHSIALGKEATVTAPHSMALGESASVASPKGEGLAIGLQSQTTADFAVAIGKGAKASGESSLVLGNNSSATANNAIVLGNDQKINAAAVGIGQSNTIGFNGSGAVALGINNQVEGSNAIIIGQDNNVGEGTIAIGKGIEINTSTRSVVVGDISGDFSNLITGPIVLGDVGMKDVGQGLIAVGRGLEEANGGGGNITMLGSNLINGGANNESGYRDITMLGDGYYAVSDKLGNSWGNPVFMFGSTALLNYTGYYVGFQIDEDGTTHFIGDLDVAGNVISASDYRLKTDIRPRQWEASFLDSITPVSFRYKSDRKQRMQLGFIAQEVQKYFPELVMSDAKGMLSMNYIGLVPVLWQINQQINRKVENLERKVSEQQRLLDEKERKIIELESTLKAEIEAIKVKIGM